MRRNTITVVDTTDSNKNFSFDYRELSKENIDLLKRVFAIISEKSDNLCIKITEPEICQPPAEGDYVYVSQVMDYDPRAWHLYKYKSALNYGFSVEGGGYNRGGTVNFVIPAKHFRIDDMYYSVTHAFEIKRKEDGTFEVVQHNL